MKKEYLMAPVIEIEDGDKMKALNMFPIFVIAFLFGLVPTTILCVINCNWLRVNKTIIVLIICLSTSVLVGKYLILYNNYSINEDIINTYQTNNDSNSSNSNDEDILVSETNDSVIKNWSTLKLCMSYGEKVLAILLALCSYLIYKINYKVVMNLTGDSVPIFRWIIFAMVIHFYVWFKIIYEFFGGSLW